MASLLAWCCTCEYQDTSGDAPLLSTVLLKYCLDERVSLGVCESVYDHSGEASEVSTPRCISYFCDCQTSPPEDSSSSADPPCIKHTSIHTSNIIYPPIPSHTVAQQYKPSKYIKNLSRYIYNGLSLVIIIIIEFNTQSGTFTMAIEQKGETQGP